MTRVGLTNPCPDERFNALKHALYAVESLEPSVPSLSATALMTLEHRVKVLQWVTAIEDGNARLTAKGKKLRLPFCGKEFTATITQAFHWQLHQQGCDPAIAARGERAFAAAFIRALREPYLQKDGWRFRARAIIATLEHSTLLITLSPQQHNKTLYKVWRLARKHQASTPEELAVMTTALPVFHGVEEQARQLFLDEAIRRMSRLTD